MSLDVLLADTDIESALSIAYVQAVAAHAGYTCGEPPGPDRDSIDIQIAAGGTMRPKIDMQLKATTGLKGDSESFSFPLAIKNYNDLRVATQVPRLLVVLDMPVDKSQWIDISADRLILKRGAYWRSLRGSPATANSNSVTVSIPRANILDVDGLKSLMELSRSGTIA